MKVLVMYWGRRGGGPRFAYETAAALLKSRSVDVAVSYSANAEIAHDFRTLGVPQFGPKTFDSKWDLILGMCRLPIIAARFIQFTRREQIQVIYLAMESPWPLITLGMVKRACGVRVLIGIHDAHAHDGDSAWLHNWQRKRALALADGLITFSDEVRTKLSSAISRPTPIWRSIHGTFAKPDVRTPRRLMPDKPITVGFFGRILPYKGIDLLLAAFAEVQAHRPNARLQIVGDGDVEPYRTLRDTDNKIHFRNAWIPDRDVTSVVDGFDILVLPYREASQSGVIGFALGTGVPIVATPVGGLAEQVLETGGGLVSEDVTSQSLASAISMMIDDPALYHSLSRAGLDASRGVHSWERAAQDVVAACFHLIELQP